MDVGFWKDIVVSICSAIVAGAAIVGLFTWRKELTGKVKFDLARNMMLLGGKLKDNFEWARYPISQSTEAAERKKRENESEEEAQILDNWYIRKSRLRPLVENLQRLQELGYEAEVVFNKETSKITSTSIHCFRQTWADITTAIDEYFDITRREATSREKYHDQTYLTELRNMIFSTGDDTISKKIEQAKQQLVDSLKNYTK